MSIHARDPDTGGTATASALLARAAGAELRADHRLATSIDDFFLAGDGRLDDRVRARLAATLEALVGAIEAAIRAHAARLLAARGLTALAVDVGSGAPVALDRLLGAGLMRDPAVMHELIGRVRQSLIAEALPVEAAPLGSSGKADQPSLLARLSRHADHVVATGAVALLATESRRRAPLVAGATTRTDLPAAIQQRLIWWVAATVREATTSDGAGTTEPLDRALAESAQRSVAAHDESDRLEAAATRLAIALDPRAEELAALLAEALADQRLSLFIALLGHALGLHYADMRDIVLDPDAERLWLVLRALELDRPAIARIGLALCEADPRRDVEQFADLLDTIVAVDPAQARAAIAPLLLHPEYRAAVLAIARGAKA